MLPAPLTQEQTWQALVERINQLEVQQAEARDTIVALTSALADQSENVVIGNKPLAAISLPKVNLPTWDGKGSSTQWLSFKFALEQLFAASGRVETDKSKVATLIQSLTHDARDVMRMYMEKFKSISLDTPYAEVIAILDTHYYSGNDESVARKALSSFKYMGGSIDGFHRKFTELLLRIPTMPDSESYSAYMTALSKSAASLYRFVEQNLCALETLQPNANVRSIATAQKFAVIWYNSERGTEMSNARAATHNTAGPSDGPSPMDLGYMRSRTDHRPGQVSIPGVDGSVYPQVQCYECNRHGHFQSQCPLTHSRPNPSSRGTGRAERRGVSRGRILPSRGRTSRGRSGSRGRGRNMHLNAVSSEHEEYDYEQYDVVDYYDETGEVEETDAEHTQSAS